MNTVSEPNGHHTWVWQVTGLCFLLGFLVAGSLQLVNKVHRAGTGVGRVGATPFLEGGSVVKQKEQEREITQLRERNTKLEYALAQNGGAAKTLNEELQKTKALAGLTAMTGPGVILVLQDGRKRPTNPDAQLYDPNLIHDVTLQRALNELIASGAEAISINGERITSRTAIRCVGPTAIINGVPKASPYEIKVIGDSATLVGGLNIAEGFMDYMRSVDPTMARIDKKNQLIVPAYTGSSEMRYAKPVKSEDKPDKGAAG